MGISVERVVHDSISSDILFDEYREAVSCFICDGILVDGQMVSTCQHMFCKECIVEWMTKATKASSTIMAFWSSASPTYVHNCPVCRDEFILSQLVKSRL